MQIYLGLTTLGDKWTEKIQEIDSLGISEIALFPTVLDGESRKLFYDRLKDSSLKGAPFVHLRTDMERWELDFFIEEYDTKVFNLHPSIEAIEFLRQNSDLKEMIFVENCLDMTHYEETLSLAAGICLDISHYEDFAIRQNLPSQERFKQLLGQYPVGCTHLPAIRDEKYQALTHGDEFMVYESHTMSTLSEMDYIKKHRQYLGQFNAIELNNSLAEQIKARDYLQNLIEQ